MSISHNTEINAWTRRYIKTQIETLDDDVEDMKADVEDMKATVIIPTATPVNAVAASKVLTVSGTPAEGNTVSAGGVEYTFRAALNAGVAASATLTITDVNHEGDIISFANVDYKLTATVAAANDVLLEATVTATIDNLVSAFNGSAGEGEQYGSGTTNIARPQFLASKGSAATFVVTAKAVGFDSNGVSTTQTATHSAWGSTVTAGGVDAQGVNDVLIGINAEAAIDNLVLAITAGTGAGTKYGTGTVINPLVTAVKATAATMTVTNKIKGTIGHATVIAKSGTNLAWASAAVLLSGGVDGTLGVAGQMVWDASYVYLCTATNTISGSNWKKATLA